MKKSNFNKRKEYAIVDVVIGIVMVLAYCFGVKYLCYHFNSIPEYIKNLLKEGSTLDLLLNQYTITFLIVSLLSLLSGNSEYIYWVNILEQKIIMPLHRNFISLTIYAFISMLAGTISYIVNDQILVLSYFLLDVVILVILTLKMVGVFFGKARIQFQLHKEMTKEVSIYLDTKDEEKLKSICEKLDGMYENAYKLANDGKFGEILETDFQLLIEIIEKMPKEYDELLVKAVYSNMSRIIMLFSSDPEILLSELSKKYAATNNTINHQTSVIMQSALCGFFESILGRREYRVCYDEWIADIYEVLTEAYNKIDKDLNNTLIIEPGYEYHSLLVDVWYNPLFLEENNDEFMELQHIPGKINVVRSKLVHFAKLIYENSPSLFFTIVSKKNMLEEIQKQTELFSLICKHDKFISAIDACIMICNQLYIFQVCEYICEYRDYKNMPAGVIGTGFNNKTFIFDKSAFYKIHPKFVSMLRCAAFEVRSSEVTECLLGHINNTILSVMHYLLDEKDKYPLLINENTWEYLYEKVHITGYDIDEMIIRIEREYKGYVGIISWIEQIKPLCEGNYNLDNYKQHIRTNFSQWGSKFFDL